MKLSSRLTTRSVSRSATTSAVGVLALATMMSMAALGNSAGASVVLAASYPGSQQGVRTACDEELLNWITCLTQAAKSLRGGPRLPEHLGAAVALPSMASLSLPSLTLSFQSHHQDQLPSSQTILLPHLINLPPPALA